MKNNYHWVLLGVALGILIYIADKYVFRVNHRFNEKYQFYICVWDSSTWYAK